ncbi:MAG: hypothetical protein JWQ54_2192 [Mucilaginibacter sp.]|nr:hypothetical protein [Mucilaginibacter sp.]
MENIICKLFSDDFYQFIFNSCAVTRTLQIRYAFGNDRSYDTLHFIIFYTNNSSLYNLTPSTLGALPGIYVQKERLQVLKTGNNNIPYNNLHLQPIYR